MCHSSVSPLLFVKSVGYYFVNSSFSLYYDCNEKEQLPSNEINADNLLKGHRDSKQCQSRGRGSLGQIRII